MVIKSGYSHISEPALELHSRAAPSVGGNITAQSVLTQGEISEEDRSEKTYWQKTICGVGIKQLFYVYAPAMPPVNNGLLHCCKDYISQLVQRHSNKLAKIGPRLRSKKINSKVIAQIKHQKSFNFNLGESHPLVLTQFVI